jgi:hypothetical protein
MSRIYAAFVPAFAPAPYSRRYEEKGAPELGWAGGGHEKVDTYRDLGAALAKFQALRAVMIEYIKTTQDDLRAHKIKNGSTAGNGCCKADPLSKEIAARLRPGVSFLAPQAALERERAPARSSFFFNSTQLWRQAFSAPSSWPNVPAAPQQCGCGQPAITRVWHAVLALRLPARELSPSAPAVPPRSAPVLRQISGDGRAAV